MPHHHEGNCVIQLTPVETLDANYRLAKMGMSFEVYHREHGQHQLNPSTSMESQSSENSLRLFERLVLIISLLLIVSSLPFSILLCIRVIRHFERVVILRLGRIVKDNPFGPGTIFVIPCTDSAQRVDLRVSQFEIEPTDIMLQDCIQIRMQAVVWCRIICPLSAVVSTENYHTAAKLLCTGAIRRFFGYKTLYEVVSQERTFKEDIKIDINQVTLRFGVKIERVEMKTLKIENQFQATIALEGRAFANAKAREISSVGEKEAAADLVKAAKNTNRTALQMRFMQTINSIQTKTDQGSTLFYPVPLDMGFKGMLEQNRKAKEMWREKMKSWKKRS